MRDLDLERTFEPRHGEAVPVAPGLLRITAPNPGPLTFHGTNSYLVGAERLVLVDPGPDDPAHLDALRRAAAGRPVTAVLLTHTHRDHAALARAAREAFGAPLLFEGRHRPSRPVRPGEEALLDASAVNDLLPDRAVADGEVLSLGDVPLRAVSTPGHAANHLAFAVENGPAAGALLSGDHVMAWSTTVVAPPDGSMAAYMRSLDKLLARGGDAIYFPGHGGPVERPAAFVRAIRAHRLLREAAILSAVEAGCDRVPAIVARVYRTTDARLRGAAALATLAHLESLVERGLVSSDAPPALGARFAPA